jgi:hypothetical protein
MTKLEDIPQWAWEKAAIFVGTTDQPDLARHWIARAILSAIEEERESAANVARDWLNEWAGDLAETRDSYIEAKRSGRHSGRRMSLDDADFYAKQFRERAEAVAGCADQVANAIRSRKEPTK